MKGERVPVPPRGEILSEIEWIPVPHGFDVRVSFRGLGDRMAEFEPKHRLLCAFGALADTLIQAEGVPIEVLHRKLDTLPPVKRIEIKE